jgi:hypothetical protein
LKNIIDANYFRIPELKLFLDSSPDNCVVFSDYACMEAYKGNSIICISESLKIISDHPSQVIVLKGTEKIASITTEPFEIDGFIDPDQTSDFKQFCRYVDMASNGNAKLKRQILDHGEVANNHFKKMLYDAKHLGQAFTDISKSYSKDELRELRSIKSFDYDFECSDNLMKKLINGIHLMSKFCHENITQKTPVPKIENYYNSYLFRFSLCGYLLALRWVTSGGACGVNAEKLRNDVVDMHYATYATYFDGLLTNDKKLTSIYNDARFWLDAVFRH